ncbi:hypothetical protein BKA80DRAFT_308211 [Phyllosticta citrichinensis]
MQSRDLQAAQMGIKDHFERLRRKIHHVSPPKREHSQQSTQTPILPRSRLEQLPVELLVEIGKFLDVEDDMALRATSRTLHSVPPKLPNKPPDIFEIGQMAKRLWWDDVCALLADMPPGSRLRFCARCKFFHRKENFSKDQLQKDDWNRACRKDSYQRLFRICDHMALDYYELRTMQFCRVRITCSECNVSSNTFIRGYRIRLILRTIRKGKAKGNPLGTKDRCDAALCHEMLDVCLKEEQTKPFDWVFSLEFRSQPGIKFSLSSATRS